MKPGAAAKPGLHPRNRHRLGYEFAALARRSPALAPFVRPNPFGDTSIDFADPVAVQELNRALLRDYGVTYWEIPDGYLCPPVPGRADYVHHVAALLAATAGGEIPRGPEVAALDIGVGANCIYPIIGRSDYGWRWVGADVDEVALRQAEQIVARNAVLRGFVTLRRQSSREHIFRGIIAAGEQFHVTLCNPPFHASLAEAAAGTRRKLRNLGRPAGGRPVLNFGGQPGELCYPGGEPAFLQRLIRESALYGRNCRWFTSLVSRSEHLPAVQQALRQVQAREVRIIPMAQGQKKSRVVAWTFRESGRPPA